MEPLNELVAVLYPNKSKSECKGKVYRCRINKYINSKGEYVYTERMILLKRQSCSGCEHCEWMLDEIMDHMDNDSLIACDLEDGKAYRLEVANISKDWETGQVDDYDLEFVEMREDNGTRKEEKKDT